MIRSMPLQWSVLLLIGSTLLGPTTPAIADWPQFRGPTGQGIAEATNLPTTWSESQNIAWKTPIPGQGWSSPVTLCEQIWLTTATDDGCSLRAVCVDLANGKLRHDVEVFRFDEALPINPKNSHASPTPVLEAGRVYVHFGTLGTACLDTASGQVLWHNEDLKLEHKEGPGSSPVLAGELLILNCDGLDVQYVIALDKATGRPVWKTDRSVPKDKNPDFNKAYSTPLVIEADGARQVVSSGAHRVSGYAVDSGRELWWADYYGFSNVPRPVAAHGLVFAATGFPRSQLWAIRSDGKGDVTETHVAWKLTSQAPANASPIVVGDELYVVSDGGVASCLDARSGELHWKERLPGNYSASPTLADGKLYFTNEQGTTHVIEPGKEFRLLASNELKGRTLASLAIAGEAILQRTETHLYRIEKRPQGAEH